MSEQRTGVPVLAYHQYMGRDSQTVYTTHHYCGSCRRKLDSPYTFPEYPEQLEAANDTPLGLGSWEHDEGRELEYFRYCPWCGVEFEDEWRKDRVIQNERAIDHYQNPGHHKGDQHVFMGEDQSCMVGHWLSTTDPSRVCWCDPEVEPGIMGCTIRHRDRSYDEYLAEQRERAAEAEDDDDWDEP